MKPKESQRLITIAEMWAKFEGVMIPKDAPDAQRRLMKTAFYSGAEEMFNGLLWAVGGPDVDDARRDERGERWLTERQEEIAAFAKELKETLDLRASLMGKGFMSRHRSN